MTKSRRDRKPRPRPEAGTPRAVRAEHPSPPCPHYPACVGCPFVGLPYGEQLQRKRERVEAALRGAELGRAEVPPVAGAPRVFGYRTQAKLAVRATRQGLRVGIYRPGTHQLADISHCAVHHPLINDVVHAVQAEVGARGLPVYDERTHAGLIRYVCVRVSAWQRRAQLILVTAERPVPQAHSLARALQRRVRGLVSVVQNVNAEPGNVILGREFVPWTKETTLTERVGDLKIKSRAGSFLQANIPTARRLYRLAADWAAPQSGDVVVDLYCGVGALTFHLANSARRVVGVEESPTAVLDGQVNIRLNGFHNVRFRNGAVADELPRLREELRCIDVIVANPPRKGMDGRARDAVVACRPRRLVYVSCEPSTLARDLVWLEERGLRLRRVQPFDMFPQTEHVETVALLEA